jgi:hypothetical protein
MRHELREPFPGIGGTFPEGPSGIKGGTTRGTTRGMSSHGLDGPRNENRSRPRHHTCTSKLQTPSKRILTALNPRAAEIDSATLSAIVRQRLPEGPFLSPAKSR